MEVIWAAKAIPSTEIVERLKTVTKWKDNTIYTMISRLAQKGMIHIDKTVSPNLCTPLVSKQQCEREERNTFLQKVYNGSLSLMLTHIVDEGSLSNGEIEELKKILDRKDCGGKKE